MFDYFIDVGITFLSSLWLFMLYVSLGVIVWSASKTFLSNEKHSRGFSKENKKKMYFVGVLILVANIAVSLMSPTNTYIHRVHDKEQEVTEIKMERPHEKIDDEDLVLVDRQRKPRHTDEESEQRFNDMVDWKSK